MEKLNMDSWVIASQKSKPCLETLIPELICGLLRQNSNSPIASCILCPLTCSAELNFFDIVENGAKRIRLAQNFTFTKKSTLPFRSVWNLIKMISSCVGKIARISASLDKNCKFFTDGQILSQSNFFCTSLYLNSIQDWLEFFDQENWTLGVTK